MVLPRASSGGAIVLGAAQSDRWLGARSGPPHRAVTSRSGWSLKCRLLLAAWFVSLTASAAFAQVDTWEFEVYPAQTLPKGMIELESLNSFSAKGHQGEDEEYGSN